MFELLLYAVAIFGTYALVTSIKSRVSKPFGYKKMDAILHRDFDGRPTHVVCGIPSPDGVLYCRLEVGHMGWHSHHGPVSWYMGNWAEDDHSSRYGNIPW